MAVLCFALFVTTLLEIFPSLGGGWSYSKILAPSICLFEGIASVLSARDIVQRKDPARTAKKTGLYMLIALPAFMTAVAVCAIAFTTSYAHPFYWVNLALTGLLLAGRIYQVISLNRAFDLGDHDGLLPLRNLSTYSLAFAFLIFSFYALTPLKTIGLYDALTQIKEGATVVTGIGSAYMITTVATLAVDVLILFFVLYLALATLISGIENRAMDLKKNFKFTMALLRKYDLIYWLSTLAVFLFFVGALAGAITEKAQGYITLCVLYFSVLIIRIPAYFWNRAIQNRHKGNYYVIWKRKHSMMVYAAGILSAYVVVGFLLGLGNGETGMMRGALITFAFFTPWAIVKAVLGIKSLVKAEAFGDPFLEVNGNLDIALALLTISSTLFLIADAATLPFARAIGTVFTGILTVYALYVSVKMLLRGIRGLMGKRLVIYRRHEEVFKRHVDSYDLLASVSARNDRDQAKIQRYDRHTRRVLKRQTEGKKGLERYRSVATVLMMISTILAILMTLVLFTVGFGFVFVTPEQIAEALPGATEEQIAQMQALVDAVVAIIAAFGFAEGTLYLITIGVSALSSHSIQYNQIRKRYHITLLVLSFPTFQVVLCIASIYALLFNKELAKNENEKALAKAKEENVAEQN